MTKKKTAKKKEEEVKEVKDVDETVAPGTKDLKKLKLDGTDDFDQTRSDI